MPKLTLLKQDSWLKPYEQQLQARYAGYRKQLSTIEVTAGSLENFALGHQYFGFNKGEHNGEQGWWYREWAPGALSLALIGEFNGWERFRSPMKRNQFGIYELFLPASKYPDFGHGSKVKVHVVSKKHALDRIPAYCTRVVSDDTGGFVGVVWQPETPFEWKHSLPKRPTTERIYETHIGIAPEEGKIGTYEEFRLNVLPRINELGYNTIQLMAIQQHPYYASFGYQVSNFFSTSHYFGTPEELKQLIDEAHGMGIRVLLDLIHSHAVKNIYEGLNEFDGTNHQYFHAGDRGNHPAWDTKLFNYGTYEVQRFLLSNIRYWLEEFRFDGFRFDGITSMIYKDHGLNQDFNHYDHYFGPNVDEDAICYLMLANHLAHTLNPEATTIAEDVSGMPGMATPVEDGGIGFDYRLAMGVPDYWIKQLKHKKDDEWSVGDIYTTLLNRRWTEKHVAYAESHDQSLVGDKTIAFWLMDQEMYTNMSKFSQSLVVDRGIALHKMIRLITFSLGGEAYLNFMGNEFGHPEWIDFPREGKNYSFHYARRQWSLVDSDHLRYKDLWNFDQAMQVLDSEHALLADKFIEKIYDNEKKKLLIFRRGPLVFIFNFHPSESYTDFRIGVPDKRDYTVILSSDEQRYGGFDRVKEGQHYPIQERNCHGRDQSIQVYSPARTVQVLKPV